MASVPERLIRDAITPLLEEMGWKKRAGLIFTTPISPNVLGWLGLNRATLHRAPGEVEVNAVIGVRCEDVERVVAECRGVALHADLPPTVVQNLGQVSPEARYLAWLFTPENAELVAANLAQTVTNFGVPYLQSLTTLSELCRQLDAGVGIPHQAAYRRPVARLLAGDTAEARRILELEIEKLGEREDGAAMDYRKFAEALRQRLLQASQV